jgi:hypothetical protein
MQRIWGTESQKSCFLLGKIVGSLCVLGMRGRFRSEPYFTGIFVERLSEQRSSRDIIILGNEYD